MTKPVPILLSATGRSASESTAVCSLAEDGARAFPTRYRGNWTYAGLKPFLQTPKGLVKLNLC